MRPESTGAKESHRPSLCVINHNGSRYLPLSLAAVAPLRESLHEVVLVDDSSTDDSVPLVERDFPWVRVVRTERNVGPSAARNEALRAVQSDRVLFVDNDVCVPPNIVARMEEVLEAHPRAAVVMARSVYHDRPDVIQFDGAQAHFIGLQRVEPSDVPLSTGAKEPRTIESLISACFMLDRARAGRDLEFDDAFFIYLEDHDFGLRVRARGRELVAVPDVVCLHGAGTESISIRQTGTYSKRRVFCLIRNRWLVLLSNYALRTLVLLSPILLLYELAQLAIVLKKGWMSEWLSAVRWMLAHVPEVVRQRRAVQAKRVVPDRALLGGGPIPFRRELAVGRLERWGEGALNGLASAYWTLVGRWI